MDFSNFRKKSLKRLIGKDDLFTELFKNIYKVKYLRRKQIYANLTCFLEQYIIYFGKMNVVSQQYKALPDSMVYYTSGIG